MHMVLPTTPCFPIGVNVNVFAAAHRVRRSPRDIAPRSATGDDGRSPSSSSCASMALTTDVFRNFKPSFDFSFVNHSELFNRYNIVNGVVEVDGVAQEPTSENAAEGGDSDAKGIPDFWITALKSNEIQERDEPILKYLKDMKWSRIDDPKGFKLDFFFHANPFLKNSVQTKTYHMVDEDDPILEKAIDGIRKNVTCKILKKKPKKGSKNTKPITKTEESTIRDTIIPHAISWFTGEAVQAEDFDDMEDGDEDDDDEEDDKDEDKDEDEDEDEEELNKPTKKVAGKTKGDQVIDDDTTVVLVVPDACCGALIGKGGTIIKYAPPCSALLCFLSSPLFS
ncbi:hypothetical protein ZWY2020_042444 [Hordeum vulgare]|nr:hypothetical protein ZWY2020_042444 [Hordeum vulgare]